MIIPANILAELTDRSIDDITVVVIHHTADDSQNKEAEEIAKEEEASQGFLTIGYHFLIHGDATIEVCRPIEKVPAANLGANQQSVAISLEGNFEPGDAGYKGEVPSQAMVEAAIMIINGWVKPKCKNLKHLIGHRDVAVIYANSGFATACPGQLLYDKMEYFRQSTGLTYGA